MDRGRVPSWGRRNRPSSKYGSTLSTNARTDHQPDPGSVDSIDCLHFPELPTAAAAVNTSGGKSPNIFAKSLAERCGNKGGNNRNSRHDSAKERSLIRKPRSSSKRDHVSTSDLECDPLNLLAMMGYERMDDVAEVSFADLLSSSPTPAVNPLATSSSQRCGSQKGGSSSQRSSSGDQKAEDSRTPCVTPTPAVTVSVPLSVPVAVQQPKLSYSPPSISSEDSFICYDASPASGTRIPMSHSMIAAGGQGSSFLSALMVSTSISIPTSPPAPSPSSPSSPSSVYYPYLLDDPELIAAKQHHSHAAYPSYIVSTSLF